MHSGQARAPACADNTSRPGEEQPWQSARARVLASHGIRPHLVPTYTDLQQASAGGKWPAPSSSMRTRTHRECDTREVGGQGPAFRQRAAQVAPSKVQELEGVWKDPFGTQAAAERQPL